MHTIILVAMCATSIVAPTSAHVVIDATLREIEDVKMNIPDQQDITHDRKVMMRREKKAMMRTEERKVKTRKPLKPQASDDANHIKLDTFTSIETMKVKSSNE